MDDVNSIGNSTAIYCNNGSDRTRPNTPPKPCAAPETRTLPLFVILIDRLKRFEKALGRGDTCAVDDVSHRVGSEADEYKPAHDKFYPTGVADNSVRSICHRH